MNILIAIGSSYGSTRGIADRIAATLQQRGHTASVQNADQVSSLAPYEAVILGSGVYAGKLHGDVLKLAKRESAALAAKHVGAFSVSLSAAESTPTAQAQTAAYLKPLQELLTIEQVANLAGAWDPKSAPLLVRLVMKLIGAKPGDLRDWEVVEAWAAELATAWA